MIVAALPLQAPELRLWGFSGEKCSILRRKGARIRPMKKSEPFFIIRLKRDGVSETKVQTTKTKAETLAKSLKSVGADVSEIEHVVLPDTRDRRARFLQAALNGEPLTDYYEQPNPKGPSSEA